MVARYADACNLFDTGNDSFKDDLGHKLRVLRDHCAAAGRDVAEISKTVTTSFELGEDRQRGLADLLSHLRELAALGIDHALVTPRRCWDDATFEAIASILPQVHAAVLASPC
jgi:hypothetical protein